MSTDLGLVLDPVFEEHDTGPGHPERAERLVRVRRALTASGVPNRSRMIRPSPATDEALRRVHAAGHIERVARASAEGATVLDSMDCALGSETARVARLAAGTLTALCEEVAAGKLRRGFAAVRPPGHHAERDLAMGFCFFNNVAVAARHLVDGLGLARVLIVDWDVHHGNGTQHLFEEDPAVFYFSLHQWPLYPGTGAATETGRGAGRGTTCNVPLPAGAGDDAFLGALREQLLPAAERFRPEFVLVSAGFDAHERDPLAGLEVTTDAYAEATRLLRDVASGTAEHRLVSVLEGGYDLDALAESVTTHIEALL